MATFKVNKVFANGKISKAHELIEAETEDAAKELYAAKHAKKYKVFGLQIVEIQPSLKAEDIAIKEYNLNDLDIEETQHEIDKAVHEACTHAAA